MSRPSDWKARSEALDPERSFIVQAPAGSGKTELLAQRMLVLLARVDHPEEAVAITFTRKAAAEMSHRIMKHLRAAASAKSDSGLEPHQRLSRELARRALENDRRLGWNLLEQPSRLRVRTIDSLSGELARQLPILSGMGGDFHVTEQVQPLYREAAMRTMSAIERNGDSLQNDVRRMLDRYDNRYDRLVDMLTGMLASRDQWLAFLLASRRGDGFDRHALENALERLVRAELRKAAELAPGWLFEELPRILMFTLQHEPDDRNAIEALLKHTTAGGIIALPDDPAVLPQWNALANRLLSQSGNWFASAQGKHGFPPQKNAADTEEEERFRGFKEDFKQILTRLGEHDEFREQLALVRGLPAPAFDEDAWSALESMSRILLRATQEWQIVMGETGTVDFTEVATRAIQALGDPQEPTDLALRMDYRIRHLLVDEFQDTSHGQVRLLKGLTAGWSDGDGRTLFLVGDPMQSIYRFRKAEVSLFIRAFEGSLFDHLRMEPLQLTVNFRSTASVVEWINDRFFHVLPAQNDAVSGAVRYSPSVPHPGAGEEGRQEVHLFGTRDDRREAQQVVDILGASRPGDHVAILVRARTHAREILALLDRLKREDDRFSYRAVRFTPLADTTLVRDLVSLTLALTQPADRLSWLAVLRAPFVGLELADLDALAGGKDAGLIVDALADAASNDSLSADGRRRLRRAGPLLLQASGQQGLASVRTRVESCWLRLGGPACLDNESELADAATFFDLLSSLEEDDVPIDRDSLARELKELRAEEDAHATAAPLIDVMTIYEAKGLEFDTVILPGLNKTTSNDSSKLLYWFELADEDQVVMCPMRDQHEKERQKKNGDLIQYISTIENRRQSLENGRVLYVAATRARRDLHLLGAIEPDRKNNVRPKNGTLLAELWPAVAAELAPRVLADAADQQEASGNEAAFELPQIQRRLVTGWKPPPAPGPVQQAATAEPEPPESIEFHWAGEDARLTGELVHRLLQFVAENGMAAWHEKGGMQGVEAWCREQLVTEGASGMRSDAIIRRTGQAVENTLASATGRWILSDHDESSCEHAMTALLHGRAVKLVLDRTFVDEGTRWIIDYKTSVHEGGSLEDFLQSESDRYREQMERYRRAMALSEKRPIRAALYFPLLDHFLEV